MSLDGISKVIPEVGDAIYIQSEFYTGDAVVTFVNHPDLYLHHFLPIQVQIDEYDLHKFDDFNHGQTVFRISLKEIAAFQSSDEPETIVIEEGQGSFDI